MNDSQPIESLRIGASPFPDSLSNDEILSLLEAAKTSNEPESARALMSVMLRQLRAGNRSISPYVDNWIIYAFGQILEEGRSADEAFGLKGIRGKHKRPDTHDRDLIAAAIVILAMRSGTKWEDAVGDAANKLFEDGRGDKAVQAAYTKHRDTLQLLPSASLAAIVSE